MLVKVLINPGDIVLKFVLFSKLNFVFYFSICTLSHHQIPVNMGMDVIQNGWGSHRLTGQSPFLKTMWNKARTWCFVFVFWVHPSGLWTWLNLTSKSVFRPSLKHSSISLWSFIILWCLSAVTSSWRGSWKDGWKKRAVCSRLWVGYAELGHDNYNIVAAVMTQNQVMLSEQTADGVLWWEKHFTDEIMTKWPLHHQLFKDEWSPRRKVTGLVCKCST